MRPLYGTSAGRALDGCLRAVGGGALRAVGLGEASAAGRALGAGGALHVGRALGIGRTLHIGWSLAATLGTLLQSAATSTGAAGALAETVGLDRRGSDEKRGRDRGEDSGVSVGHGSVGGGEFDRAEFRHGDAPALAVVALDGEAFAIRRGP
jgi:hypothetical protein